MANFGVDRLVVSDAQIEDWDAAAKLAVHSGHVLGNLERTSTLPEAVTGAVYACGTTFRSQVGARYALSPEAGVERLRAEAKRGPVALVLGGERRGLSDEELVACDDFLTIPTDARQPSMNLAQATTVLLYLLAREGASFVEPEPEPAARIQTVQALETVMRDGLSRAGFLNPQSPEAVLQELVHVLRRGRPSQREVELWTGAFRQVVRVIRASESETPSE
jgi:tRNA/rRNA methyltransferase